MKRKQVIEQKRTQKKTEGTENNNNNNKFFKFQDEEKLKKGRKKNDCRIAVISKICAGKNTSRDTQGQRENLGNVKEKLIRKTCFYERSGPPVPLVPLGPTIYPAPLGPQICSSSRNFSFIFTPSLLTKAYFVKGDTTKFMIRHIFVIFPKVALQ